MAVFVVAVVRFVHPLYVRHSARTLRLPAIAAGDLLLLFCFVGGILCVRILVLAVDRQSTRRSRVLVAADRCVCRTVISAIYHWLIAIITKASSEYHFWFL